MSETDTQNIDDGAYELLVAYLDGELDLEKCPLVERRLAEDESFRSDLRQLQFTWDLLDELPKVEASETFTQTTVEIVALSVEQDVRKEKRNQRRFGRLARSLTAGGVVATVVISYFFLSAVLSRPNDQLIEDLPVIEDVDLYRVAGSVEFLRRLDEEQLFNEEVDDGL